MRPLRIKASGSPPSSANFQGLQEMTDTEIQQYLSYVITNKFATDWDGTGTAEINMDTSNALSGSAIGTFTDTTRNDAIGTHPTAGATTDTTYYFKQVTSTAAESITNRAVGWDTGAINEFTDAELDTDIIDKVIDDMVSESDYTVGQFHLAASSPAGGTWTSRYTITDTVLSGNNTTYLWQKTSPTSAANSDYASLKYDSGLKMMTAAEIEQMVPNFRNRIVEGYGSTPGVGCYLVQATTPTETGTWTQMGDAAGFSDTRQQVASSTYAGSYSGAYTGAFSNSFSGNFSGGYTGAKTYTGAYTGTFSGNYAGNYVGTSTYAGAYTGDFTGTYILYYAGYVGAYYAGTYSRNFTGYFTGPKTYTGTYTGAYNRAFSGDYVGTSAYSGTYTGSFTGYFSADFTGAYVGNYAGDTIKASTETVSTIKLWLRTA